MKTYLLLFLGIIVSGLLTAQNTHDKIEAALLDYTEGTSYNYIERIKNAFHPESDLFLDGEEGAIRIVPSSQYIAWFEKNERGKFNERIGNILSIEQFGNIAMAKAEIIMPARGTTFIDMFILKEEKGEWKIISKTANSEPSNKTGERVLFITSNAEFYGDSDIKNGNSLSELVNAHKTFDDAGYTVDIMSPEGGNIPLGYLDFRDELQMEYIRKNDFMYAISHTKSVDEIDASDYRAVYYVGGGSAMFGVPTNKAIHKLVMEIYEEGNGVISSVCHGTAGIVNLKTKDGKYLVDGKRICGYPDEYERRDRPYFATMPFMIGETITSRGGDFRYSERESVHVESQDRVVTGQNNLSSRQVAMKVIDLLKDENQ